MILSYFAVIQLIQLIFIINSAFGADKPAGAANIEKLDSNYGTIVNLNLKLKGGRGRGPGKTQNIQFHIPPAGSSVPQPAGEDGPGDQNSGKDDRPGGDKSDKGDPFDSERGGKGRPEVKNPGKGDDRSGRPFERPDRDRFSQDRFDQGRWSGQFPGKDRDDRGRFPGRHEDRRGGDRHRQGSGRGRHRDEDQPVFLDNQGRIPRNEGIQQPFEPHDVIILGLSGPAGLRRVAQNLPTDVGVDMSTTKVNYVVFPPDEFEDLLGQSVPA